MTKLKDLIPQEYSTRLSIQLQILDGEKINPANQGKAKQSDYVNIKVFNTKMCQVYSHYKPISKIVNLQRLNEKD